MWLVLTHSSKSENGHRLPEAEHAVDSSTYAPLSVTVKQEHADQAPSNGQPISQSAEVPNRKRKRDGQSIVSHVVIIDAHIISR